MRMLQLMEIGTDNERICQIREKYRDCLETSSRETSCDFKSHALSRLHTLTALLGRDYGIVCELSGESGQSERGDRRLRHQSCHEKGFLKAIEKCDHVFEDDAVLLKENVFGMAPVRSSFLLRAKAMPWMSDPGEIRRHREPKPAPPPENPSPSGYSYDDQTNRRGLKVRRLRFRMAKVKLSAECSPATAWAVELTCTKDFESDMKALSQLNEPSKAVKKSCRTILRYYHCLTPVTESASCQKNPEFIKHLEYFPKAITARYKEVCLRELEISPSLFKEKETTENPFYPPLRKMPLEPRIPQAEDYPRSHDDDDSSASERKRPEPRRDNDDHPSRDSRRGKHARKGGAHHGGGGYDERSSNNAEERGRNSGEGNVRKGGFKGSRGEGRRNRPNNWGAKRDDLDKNDGYPADPNDGFLEDSEPEGMNQRKKKLNEQL
ncbi:hypothetical protein HPB52_008328 [Rhipicephalus sanguineus]|uniref:Uncharacterized protein n=1 Tax=Rhipicephalus sanguineus TaxID=34632 RepID=A0A9D4QHC0_RHISA|nr:hypothetical protein HPB52_008328 [Rhipicephalus sanguineus]